MYGSPASSKDLNLSFQPKPLKQGSKDGDRKHHHRHPPPPQPPPSQQQQQQQLSAGLLRFRSAPTSLMGDLSEDFLPQRSSTSPEEDTMFARLVSSDPRDRPGEKPPHPAAPSGGAAPAQRGSHLIRVMEHGSTEAEPQRGGGFSSSPSSQLMYLPLQRQQLPSHRPGAAAAAENSYQGATSAATDRDQAENGATVSGLVRHSSSPAGLFAHLGSEGGYAMMRGMYRPGAGPAGEATSDGGRLKSQISFSSRQSSSSGLMSPISGIGSDRVVGGHAPPEDGSRCFIPGMPVASWEDPSLLSDSFAGSSRRARDLITEAGQNGDARFPVPGLSHHFSLPPDASSEMARILQFQDAVPCKIRAKRGCATHPRSIAERVRRTRISERMRKLQELVPNMDKQTSTADMLDLAVDYIKDLQRRVKSLSESRAGCTCSSRHKAA